MQLTDKIQYAINRAAELHDGQVRKISKVPFFVHPFSVAVILSGYTDDEDIIIAGILHDILEDVPEYSYDEMKKEFGKRVADIVKGVTEEMSPRTNESAKTSWLERKENYLKKLRSDSMEALMISAADKIHNLNSMIDEYKRIGEKIWSQFNAPEGRKLWFYGEVLKILKERLDNPIVKQLEKTFEEADALFDEDK